MHLRAIHVAIAIVASALPAYCEQQVVQYRGDGFSFTHPATWRRQVTASFVELHTPDAIAFRLFDLGDKDRNSLFANYLSYVQAGRLGFPATFDSGTEPTVYGAWRGDSIHGNAQYRGFRLIVSATAIEANGKFYLFQMIAPAALSWQAYEYRATLANSLTFRSLPVQSKGSTGPCANCFEMWTSAMDRINATTLKGMR